MPIIAFAIWPLVTLVLFTKLSSKQAVLASMLGGYLLLPESYEIDLSGLPPIDKSFIILVSLLIGLTFFKPQRNQTSNNQEALVENQYRILGLLIGGMILLLSVNALLVVQTNREALVFGPIRLPGLSFKDAITMLSDIPIMIIPFMIARKLFSQPEDHRMLLRFLVVAALAYSVLILFEMRFSPQLHRWVYGFHQHSFAQHVRDGHFRPKVFLSHGLTVGLFLFTAAIAAATLFITAQKVGKAKGLMVLVFLLGLLVLSRNLGATAIALFLVPFLWATPRIRLLCITTTTVIFLVYPALRQAQLLPLDRVLSVAESISPERANSFQFRLDNEDVLLERALEKPMSGWGGWSRSRVFLENGVDISTTDGLWIIQLGSQGWLGYIGLFSLLTLPLLLLSKVKKRKEIPLETYGIALIIVGNLIYLIPNATLSPIGWMLAGALAGFVQFDANAQAEPDEALKNSDQTGRYSRFS